MRDLKKVLSLTIALVMCLAMFTTAFGAFTDQEAVNASPYAAKINTLADMGILIGGDGGNFDGDGVFTRAQAAKLFYYINHADESTLGIYAVQKFDDVPSTHWAAKYIAYASSVGAIIGVGEKGESGLPLFKPDDPVKVVDVIKIFLYSILGYGAELLSYPDGFVSEAANMGMGDGITGFSRADGIATRAEVAALLYNAIFKCNVVKDIYSKPLGQGVVANTTLQSNYAQQLVVGPLHSMFQPYGVQVWKIKDITNAFVYSDASNKSVATENFVIRTTGGAVLDIAAGENALLETLKLGDLVSFKYVDANNINGYEKTEKILTSTMAVTPATKTENIPAVAITALGNYPNDAAPAFDVDLTSYVYLNHNASSAAACMGTLLGTRVDYKYTVLSHAVATTTLKVVLAETWENKIVNTVSGNNVTFVGSAAVHTFESIPEGLASGDTVLFYSGADGKAIQHPRVIANSKPTAYNTANASYTIGGAAYFAAVGMSGSFVINTANDFLLNTVGDIFAVRAANNGYKGKASSALTASGTYMAINGVNVRYKSTVPGVDEVFNVAYRENIFGLISGWEATGMTKRGATGNFTDTTVTNIANASGVPTGITNGDSTYPSFSTPTSLISIYKYVQAAPTSTMTLLNENDFDWQGAFLYKKATNALTFGTTSYPMPTNATVFVMVNGKIEAVGSTADLKQDSTTSVGNWTDVYAPDGIVEFIVVNAAAITDVFPSSTAAHSNQTTYGGKIGWFVNSSKVYTAVGDTTGNVTSDITINYDGTPVTFKTAAFAGASEINLFATLGTPAIADNALVMVMATFGANGEITGLAQVATRTADASSTTLTKQVAQKFTLVGSTYVNKYSAFTITSGSESYRVSTNIETTKIFALSKAADGSNVITPMDIDQLFNESNSNFTVSVVFDAPVANATPAQNGTAKYIFVHKDGNDYTINP